MIQNGQVVLETGIARLDVGIKDGQIVALLEDSSGIDADDVIDASDKLVLPG
ncbi:MAG: hypothetical protein ACPG7F_17880, partial [Aggregatilineales bacterium]